jgi:hypothetical protein
MAHLVVPGIARPIPITREQLEEVFANTVPAAWFRACVKCRAVFQLEADEDTCEGCR